MVLFHKGTLFIDLIFQDLQATPYARKRPIEANDLLPKTGTDILENMMKLKEWKRNKRNKTTTTEKQEQWQHEVRRAPMQIQEQRVSEIT